MCCPQGFVDSQKGDRCIKNGHNQESASIHYLLAPLSKTKGSSDAVVISNATIMLIL